MADLVVTVPKPLWLDWIDEGDAVGDPETGEEWGFFVGRRRPPIDPGERLYIVSHDRVRGYAPVTRVAFVRGDGNPWGSWAIGRRGGAVAVTVPWSVGGFRGWRRRWWDRGVEQPFPDWRTENVL